MASEFDFSTLLPALSSFLDRVGNGPLELAVSLSDSKAIEEANQRIAFLESEIERLRAEYRALEMKYVCEVTISLRLTDFCRSNGVQLPSNIFSSQ